MRLRHLFILCLASSGLASLAAAKPNIIVILADDLGYGDVQCYNPLRGKIATPNIDRLAAQGMRCTDAHSSSGVCSPSRYTLLTGRYHWRTRLQQGIVDVFGKPLIAPDRLTLASLAQQHGYTTACIGKWHLGWDWPIPPEQRALFRGTSDKDAEARVALWREVFSQPIPGGPTARGFDMYFGTDVPNWPPYCFIENDRTMGIPGELLPARLLKENHLASLPGPALKDWPLEPILPTLGGRAEAFLTDPARQRQPFLLYLPLTAPHTPLAVNAEWQGKSGLLPYADLVMETDALVGRVLAALEQSGLADNTLVVFTSDNGCAPYIGAPAMEKQGHYPSGPLRGYKGDAWEGGHRIPFIVRWPGIVKPATVCGQLIHQADLLATVAGLLDFKLPDTAGEDSFSLLPLFKGSDQALREHAVSCAMSGVPALRQGPWKLIAAPSGAGGFSRREPAQPPTAVLLYNLDVDIGETTNLAAQHAQRVGVMQALLEKLIRDGRSTPGTPRTNDVDVRRFHPAADASPDNHPPK
jgi:arylsulfatase A